MIYKHPRTYVWKIKTRHTFVSLNGETIWYRTLQENFRTEFANSSVTTTTFLREQPFQTAQPQMNPRKQPYNTTSTAMLHFGVHCDSDSTWGFGSAYCSPLTAEVSGQPRCGDMIPTGSSMPCSLSLSLSLSRICFVIIACTAAFPREHQS